MAAVGGDSVYQGCFSVWRRNVLELERPGCGFENVLALAHAQLMDGFSVVGPSCKTASRSASGRRPGGTQIAGA